MTRIAIIGSRGYPGPGPIAAFVARLPADILSICGEASNGHKKLPGTNIPGSQLSVVAGARNHLDLLLTAVAMSP